MDEGGSTFDSMPMSWMSNYGTIDPNFQNPNDNSKVVSSFFLILIYVFFSNLLTRPNATIKHLLPLQKTLSFPQKLRVL